MNKRQFCECHNLTEAQFLGKKEIGGYLDLRSLTSIPEGFNPTVGGYLDLGSLTSIPEGFNPTVGGYLDLGSLTSGERPGTRPFPDNMLFEWEGGKYIKVDDIFCEVVQKRGNVWRVKYLNSDDQSYIVTDGDNYAHGNTIKDAREDLLYKTTSRDISEYEAMDPDTKLSFKDAVACYRAITGSCAFGVRSFVEEAGISKRKKYSPAQIIELTSGRYGSERFKEVFSR